MSIDHHDQSVFPAEDAFQNPASAGQAPMTDPEQIHTPDTTITTGSVADRVAALAASSETGWRPAGLSTAADGQPQLRTSAHGSGDMAPSSRHGVRNTLIASGAALLAAVGFMVTRGGSNEAEGTSITINLGGGRPNQAPAQAGGAGEQPAAPAPEAPKSDGEVFPGGAFYKDTTPTYEGSDALKEALTVHLGVFTDPQEAFMALATPFNSRLAYALNKTDGDKEHVDHMHDIVASALFSSDQKDGYLMNKIRELTPAGRGATAPYDYYVMGSSSEAKLYNQEEGRQDLNMRVQFKNDTGAFEVTLTFRRGVSVDDPSKWVIVDSKPETVTPLANN